MDKRQLSEADIRTKYITPAIVGSPDAPKWNVLTQLREEVYFTAGRVVVRGRTVQRGAARKADYLLYYKPNLCLAVVEAKDNTHSVGAGMQQALEYAELLDLPFAYSSNGDAFLEHDRTGGSATVTREIPLAQFPTPDELWQRYCAAKQLTPPRKSSPCQSAKDQQLPPTASEEAFHGQAKSLSHVVATDLQVCQSQNLPRRIDQKSRPSRCYVITTSRTG